MLPAVGHQAVFEAHGTLLERRRVRVVLHFLAAIGMRDYQFVIVAVGLSPNLVVEAGLLPFEEPNHRT